jgi:hypothetical protein
MLFRSGDNLFEETKVFCSKAEGLWMYSPFIRVNKLKDLLEKPQKCKAIVVRWQTMDILVDVTDFEKLYEYCFVNGIKLYRNRNIHLKVIRNENNRICLGSANFTNRGIGEKNYNLEFSGIFENPSNDDLKYLDDIIGGSEEVTKEYFDLLKKDIDIKRETFKKQKEELEKFKAVPEKEISVMIDSKYLLSTLPQSESPEKFWEIYTSRYDDQKYELEEINCAKHDLRTYGILSNQLTQEHFINELKKGFNGNLFICALKKELQSQSNNIMGYTQITEWISKTTRSVPTPTRQDIKDKRWVNRIHNWLPVLDDRNYWSEKRHRSSGGRGGSDLLHYIGKDEENEY